MLYDIAEVSAKFNVSKNTLRYYESVDLLPTIERNSLGIRQYTDDNIEQINKVVHMRRLGASVAETREFIHKGEPNNIEDLNEALTFLDQLNQNLSEKIKEIEQQKIFLNNKVAHLTKLKKHLKNQ